LGVIDYRFGALFHGGCALKKTALSIVKETCYRINVPAPSTISGTITDPSVNQWLHLLLAVCEELRQAKCWAQMKRTHTFSTVDGKDKYPLPKDFYAVSSFTETDRGNSWEIPTITDEEAVYCLYRVPQSTGNYAYRLLGFDENSSSISGQTFQLIPTPGAVGNITFEYLSRNLFIPRDWGASTEFSAQTYCNSGGNIYYTSAGGTTGATAPTHTTGDESDGGVTWTYYADPYEAVKADTDLCIFDYDLVKLGLRAKFLEDSGGAYEQPKLEYESKIAAAAGRLIGNKVGSFSGCVSEPRYKTPYRNWSLT